MISTKKEVLPSYQVYGSRERHFSGGEHTWHPTSTYCNCGWVETAPGLLLILLLGTGRPDAVSNTQQQLRRRPGVVSAAEIFLLRCRKYLFPGRNHRQSQQQQQNSNNGSNYTSNKRAMLTVCMYDKAMSKAHQVI